MIEIIHANWAAFCIGLTTGTGLGLFVICLISMASRSDDCEEGMYSAWRQTSKEIDNAVHLPRNHE